MVHFFGKKCTETYNRMKYSFALVIFTEPKWWLLIWLTVRLSTILFVYINYADLPLSLLILQAALILTNAPLTPPTPGTTARTSRPPAPTPWEAGPAHVPQVSRALQKLRNSSWAIYLGYGYHEAFKGCVNVDECTDGNFPHYCGPNTICTDTVGSFTCACKPGIVDQPGWHL